MPCGGWLAGPLVGRLLLVVCPNFASFSPPPPLLPFRSVCSIPQVKTPGGSLVLHYMGKKGSGPKCGDCKGKLSGIPALRPSEYKRVSKRQKNVSRAYGGSRCAACVRQRIARLLD